MNIEQHLFNLLAEAVEKLIPEDAADVYALSFYTFALDEDPRQMRLEMSHNSLTQAEAASQIVNAAEAKWNYSYWLQEPIAIFGRGSDNERRDLIMRDTWMKSEGLLYTDVEEIEYPDVVEPKAARLPGAFHEMLARVAQRLHAESVLDSRWEKALPIIIHDGTFGEETLRATRLGNPPEAITEFETWMATRV